MIKHGEISVRRYYDGDVVRETMDVESEQFTDRQYLLKEIIDGLTVITNGTTRKLTIEVCLDKQDRFKLTQRWRVQ